MKINMPVTQREIAFPKGKYIVSKTDLKGIITYANEAFVELSGFTRDELMGKNHNMVRHPDMPPQAFQWLWDTVKENRPWTGIVKNRAKNGDHYWVRAFVVPVRKNDQTIGYMSVRTEPSREEVRQAEELYKKLNDTKAKINAKGSFLQNLSIKARLVGIMAAMALMILGGAVVGVGGISLTSDSLEDAYNSHLKPSLQIAKMVELMGDNRSQMLLGLQHDPTSPFVKMHDHALDRHIEASTKNREMMEQVRGEYLKRNLNPQEKALSDAFFAARDRYSQEGTSKVRELLKAGEFHQANELILAKMNPLYKEVQERGAELQKYMLESGEQDYLAARNRFELIRNFGVGGTLFSMLMIFIGGIFLVRAIVRPMHQAIAHFDHISQGILTDDIDITGRDETGQVLSSLAGMQVHLKVMLDEILVAARTIDQKCGQLQVGMIEVVSQSELQHDRVQSVASATEEFTQSVKEVAESAVGTANAATTSQSIVQSSQENMQKSMASTARVVDAVQGSSATIADLNQAILKIGAITQTIKEIADQTNLLALNAAIEAARAGEQGRGFAVVADEVRKLAERTTTSTVDINAMVNEIQHVTHAAVTSMGDAVKEVEGGIVMMRASGDNLSNITATSRELTDMAQHIAAAAQQQAVASEEVSTNMEQVASLIESNVETARRARNDTDDLVHTAEELERLISYFEILKK